MVLDDCARTCILGIIAILSLIALVLFITQGQSNELTGTAYFSEPTYCSYDKSSDATSISCACGRATVRTGRIAQRISWKGTKDVVASGDWCLMRDQRNLCGELCKHSSLYLLNKGSVRGPTGTIELLSVEGRLYPNYGPQHQRRAWSSSYSYVSGY